MTMKSGILKYSIVALLIIGAIALVWRETVSGKEEKGQTEDGIVQIDPEFAGYIGSFTSGFISSNSVIRIRFIRELSGSQELNVPLKEKYFEFDPGIEGTTVWKDAQTMEFTPNTRLNPGQVYMARFHLGQLVEVKKELSEFDFKFQVVEQSAQLSVNDLKCYHPGDFNYYSLTGNIGTADFADKISIEKSLSAQLNQHNLNIKWVHDDNGILHRFLIDSILRPSSKEALLSIECDAKELGIKYTAKQKFTIPVKEEFLLMLVRVVTESDPFVLLNFSNPIDQDQSLEGLITMEGVKELKYIVNNNQVLVYPMNTKSGSYTLKVNEGLKDTKGRPLAKSSEHSVVFSQSNPEIRFCGNGNILTSGNGMNLAFETVNLKAVDLTIVKIYANNVLQFLQSNTMDGSYQLSQVGKRLVHKRINLGITNPAEFGVWKKFSLDLASLIKAEPGAIYRVSLGMKRAYSTYPCLGNTEDKKFEMEEVTQENEEEETNYFGYYSEQNYYYNDYDYEYNEDYDWEDRNNPCKEYYYRRTERTVSRNILATDIGLTLKKGNDGSLFVVASDLISTKPIQNLKLEVYDYQKQLILTSATNADGQAILNPEQKPYFLLAKTDKQVAYLRIDDGASLNLSMYEVGGDAIKKGLKGFIYGERGVWRPGDSLFLTFILEDKQGNLPPNHPVSFELYNPQGRLYKKLVSNKGTGGFYNFSTQTDKDAPTGLWTAQVKVGSARFNKGIRIETIMPNRLKIDVKVGDNTGLIYGTKENTIQLHTNWLTGIVAKNLNTKINLALSPVATEFPQFKSFHFDDVIQNFEARNTEIYDGKVDELGNADIPLKIDLEGRAPGLLRAAFNTMVFEPGGAFSVDYFSVNYSPYSNYVGLKLPEGEKNSGILYTGRDHEIEIATVDAKGQGVSRSKIKFEMYKLEWRWWWDQYRGELANYANDNYHKAVKTENLTSKNGRARVKVNIPEGGWGRYLIRVTDEESGHATSTITYFDWANWMEREGSGDGKIISNNLSFSTDKKAYKTGEEVKVIIPSPKNGRALITIENGTRVLEAHWLETEKGSTTFKFKVTPSMAPNVYVHISLLQPHSRSNDLPIRLYGVVPVMVDDPETHLRPLISMANTLEPEKKASLVVSEENNKEMAFTLAMVDEGLLDITRFKTPNPHATFYAKEALGVKTWDVYDQVIGAYGAELERILSIGGDGGALNKDGAKANRFKPMVKFFGPYYLNKGEKKNIQLLMPRYVGSVRVMVIAGNKGAYGFNEKTVPVKAPLMLLGTLPRVLSIGEEVKLPVSIFGGDKNIGKTEVKVEMNGLVQTIGPNTKNTVVKKNEEQVLVFDLKVNNKIGIARIKITANGGGHKASYDMELDVRNPNPFRTTVTEYYAEPGKVLSQNCTAPGIPGTNTGVLEVSSLPPINLEERLDYLISYPHGCIEQTTSKVFAQLYLPDLTSLNAERKVQVENNIKSGIQEIAKFQLSNGGLTYWQGSQSANLWGTTYAGHFMLLAEKKGYLLPSSFKKNWLQYQTSRAQDFNVAEGKYYSNDQVQAYRLYVLALANNPVIGAMNRLREYPSLTNQAKWLLAAAYAQMGELDEAEKLISKAEPEVSPYRVNYYTYGSSERDLAIVLQTLCLMNKKPQAFSQLKKVAAYLSSSSWYSTQTTAFGLLAVADFVRKFGISSGMQARCYVNGKESDLKGSSPFVQIPIAFKGGNSAEFKVENKGSGVLFVRVISRGKPPIGEEQEGNEHISTSIGFKDLEGKTIQPNEIPQGSNFLMTVTVRNPGAVGEIKNLAISNYIPSGWEIHNSRLVDNESAMKNSEFSYQDIRDDRVLTYLDLNSTESKHFTLMLNATYEGLYYLPGLNVEAMYDNSVYARTKGQWIRVVKTGTGAQGN
jgi:hypothetical protein